MKKNQLYKIAELRNSGYKIRWVTRDLSEGKIMYSRLSEIKPNGKFILYDNDNIILENDEINSDCSNFSDSEEDRLERTYNSDTNYESDSSSQSSSEDNSKESIRKLEEIKKKESLKRSLDYYKRDNCCDTLIINIIIMIVILLFGILIQLSNEKHFLN